MPAVGHAVHDGAHARPWRWHGSFADLRERFLTASPFAHLVIDDFYDAEALRHAYRDIPHHDDAAWTRWGSGGEEQCRPEDSKRGIADTNALPPSIATILKTLNGTHMIDDVGAATGVAGLVPDPTLWGGGLQCSGRGARLRVHADRSRHPDVQRFDQSINLLLYINPDWQLDYGGDLELWSADATIRVASIAPVFNRLVLFKSDRTTFHGHPQPNRCPSGLYRSSLAVFYYLERSDPEQPLVNKVQWR